MIPNADANSMRTTVVAAARTLRPLIKSLQQQAEGDRRLPQELAKAMGDAGLYHMYLPRTCGGLELPPNAAFDAIEELSKTDGSVGWCVMNANVVALAAGWLTPEISKQLFGQPPRLFGAGSLRPLGRARLVNDGYIVTGKWDFASGLHNANWLHCPCIVMEQDAPKLTAQGTPVARTMWVPRSAATPLDAWSVIGLRATGSDDFSVAEHFVPYEHSHSIVEAAKNPTPLYGTRTFIVFAYALFSANALGIARGALDALIEMGTSKASSLSPVFLRDRPEVQASVGRSEAIINAARCYVVESLSRLWSAVSAEKADPTRELALSRLAIRHSIQEALRAVDIVFEAAGTNSIYTANPIERPFRDIHVAARHYAASPIHYESGGKVLMGLRPPEPGW